MKRIGYKRMLGVTMIEILLVTVIIASFIFMGTGYIQQRATNLRIDRTALQMQQIMNAALAYYVNNGTWPVDPNSTDGSDLSLLKPDYLPDITIKSPWGTSYYIGKSNQNFYVWTTVTQSASAKTASPYSKIIAGKLPFGYSTSTVSTTITPPAVDTDTSGACPASATTCSVVSFVNIPGQNLNNATAINFAGLYHHGACVPVPSCPVDADGASMTPSVYIIPVSVSGVNDAASGSTNVYPISSFTGYATGPAANPDACTGGTQVACSPNDPAPQSGQYWRACLDLITERGSLAGTGTGGNEWGQYVTLMAVTRCAGVKEPSGSPFTVFSN